jgi:hypothetical protein
MLTEGAWLCKGWLTSMRAAKRKQSKVGRKMMRSEMNHIPFNGWAGCCTKTKAPVLALR